MNQFLRVHGRLFLATILLLVLASCHWQVQIDDVYISYTYADQWVHQSALQWQSGERVEGYSNFLWVVFQALGILVGAPPGLWVKTASLMSGFAVLLLLHRWLPRTPIGTFLLLALSVWEPFDWWAVIGMETMTAGLCLMLGWRALVQGKWSVAMAWLAGFSLLRPEGLLLLVAAALRRLAGLERSPEGFRELRLTRRDVGGGAVVAAILFYHFVRTDWFGHFWPTPYLVKLAAVHDWHAGLAELIGELLSAGGLFLGAWLSFRIRSVRALAWVVLPLALPAVLLLKAGGDWMGHARWLLPGVLAAMGAWSTGEMRMERRNPFLLLLGIPGMFLCVRTVDGAWEWRVPPRWASPLRLETPQHSDLRWLVERAPPQAVVQLGDVGMVSMLADVTVLDSNGLVDRAVALALAGIDATAVEGRYGGAHPLDCIRDVSVGEERPPALSPEFLARFPVQESLQNGSGWSVWSCRAPLCPDPQACAIRAAERWAALVAKAPDQPWLRLQYALSLLKLGREADAVAVMDSPLNPDGQGPLRLIDPAVSWEENRGFFLPTGGCFSGLPVAVPTRLELDVDDPGVEGARLKMDWRCDENWSLAMPERAIFGPETIDVVPVSCPHPPKLQICFLNDSTADGDRNVYVRPR